MRSLATKSKPTFSFINTFILRIDKRRSKKQKRSCKHYKWVGICTNVIVATFLYDRTCYASQSLAPQKATFKETSSREGSFWVLVTITLVRTKEQVTLDFYSANWKRYMKYLIPPCLYSQPTLTADKNSYYGLLQNTQIKVPLLWVPQRKL